MTNETNILLDKALKLAEVHDKHLAHHKMILEKFEATVTENYALKDTISELKKEIINLKIVLADSCLEKNEILKSIINKSI